MENRANGKSRIIEWSYDDVFTYLGMCSNGLEETYSDFSRVIEIYREATGECVIAGSDSNRTAAACGSRTGCFTCLPDEPARNPLPIRDQGMCEKL